MNLQIPVTRHMRQRLFMVEAFTIDLSDYPVVQELKASAVEAHLHIDVLHSLIKTGDLETAKKMVNDWEADQCPF